VQAAPLSKLFRGVRVKDFTHDKIGGVKRNFGGAENFIRGVREIVRGLPPVNPPMFLSCFPDVHFNK
jgi:hypothetical protein